jgi:hypothetical protein
MPHCKTWLRWPLREIGRWGGSMSDGDAVNLAALLRVSGGAHRSKDQ